MNTTTPSEPAVISQLEKILRSSTFAKVGRLKQFLRYVVDETIRGRSDDIKEYSVGLAVFEKDHAFDSRMDPVVRVQAGRLRAKLSEYYTMEGKRDSVRIDLPLGSYAPEFRWNEPLAAPSVSEAKHQNVVAVLPFADRTPGGDYEYFCQGLTSEVIRVLRGIEGVTVVSSISVSSKGSRLSHIRKLARQYGVTTVVDGSLKASNDRLQIVLHLIDAATGDSVWSKEWERSATDVLGTQEEIAHSVAQGLGGRVQPPDNPIGRPHRSTDKVTAYRLYLRGRYHWNGRNNRSSFLQAVECFERALAEDPDYALAYVGLSDSYAQLGIYDYMQPSVLGPKAINAASAGLRLDPDLAEAHTSLAHAKALFEWDFNGAEEEFGRAFELNPRYPHTHTWYAMACLVPQAKMEEALQQLVLAQTLDPVALVISLPARVHYLNRDFESAAEACRQAIELNPNHFNAYRTLGQVEEQLGNLKKAEAAFRKALTIEPQNMRVLGCLGHLLALSGKTSDARQILRSLAKWEKTQYVSPFESGFIYLTLGELDRGFGLLEEARRHRCGTLRVIKVEPRFDAFRSDPRFVALVRKVHPTG